MGQLKEWLKQDWVRIGSDGSIKGSAVLQKTRRTLTGVFRGLRRKVLVSRKEPPLPVKRSGQEPKERLLYPTHEQLKSERWGMAVLRYQRQLQNGHTKAKIFRGP